MKLRTVATYFCFTSIIAIFPLRAGADPGVTNSQILIGMSTVLVGPASFLGTSFRTGTEAYLNRVNESGGVHGRKLKLLVYDDGYEPKNTVINVQRLIKEDKVFCLLGNVGTPTTLAIKPILDEERVPLFAPFTGAESLRSPVDKYLFHYRASYNQETEMFVYGMVDVLGFKKVAVLYQNDGYGRAVLDGATRALEKRGLSPVATDTFMRNYEDVQHALALFMDKNPDAIVMAGTYNACAKFIISWKRQAILMGKKSLDPVFMNVSFVGPDMLASLLGKYGEGVVVTQVVPPVSLTGTNYPAVNEYLASLYKYFPKESPNFVSLEGYLATKVFAEILKRAGRNLTRESFIRAAERIQNLDIQAGNTISFSKENHQGSQMVYPMIIRNGAFTLITDWNALKK